MSQTLSIVICTKDRENSLRDALESVFAQTRRADEIVLVDDGNLDPGSITAWIDAHGISCQYFKKDVPGLTASRNLGVEHALGEIILFLDDDVLLESGYIKSLMEIFENDPEKRIGGATGTLKISYRPGIQPFLRFFLMDSRKPGVLLPSGFGALVREGEIDRQMPVQYLSGSNMAYRREVFNEFRFDRRLGAYGWTEDRDFSFRVSQKYTLIATPSARLVHLKDPNSRINHRHFGFMETNYLYRFFRKNMPQRPSNRLAFAWAMVGVLLKNSLVVLAPHNRPARFEQLRGNIQGLLAIHSGEDFQPEDPERS